MKPEIGYFELSCSLFKAAGEKSAAFLHGQLTNHINGLEIGQSNYNLLLTNKGKIVADLHVVRHADREFWLIVPRRFSQTVFEHLNKLAPLSRVILSDETEKYFLVHILSPSFDRLRTSLLDMVSPSNHAIMMFRADRLGIPGYDCVVPLDKKSAFLDWAKNQPLDLITPETQEVIRIEQGICEVGVDATEDNLPQEARLDRALHFDKGCYLGQEIVARLHYRGHVNRILVGLRVGANLVFAQERADTRSAPTTVIPHGTKIYRDNKEVGQITSCVFSKKLNAPLALGYVPYAQKEPGTEFEVGEERVRGVIVDLPV